METTMIDWSSLPRDLLVSIAKLTMPISVKAFMAFRSTCSSGKEAAGDEDCVKIFKWPRVPFLMIPDKAEFYSFSRKKSYFLRKPLPVGESMKLIESRFGCILTLEESGKTNLLYPFSGTWIQLPCHKTLPGYGRWSHPWIPRCQFITRSVLSANPSQTSDYVLAVLTRSGYMAFWRPGNQNWTKIKESIPRLGFFTDLVFYTMDRRFYAINIASQNVRIWVWDMNNDYVVQLTVKEPEIVGTYLVESSAGELLVVGTKMDPCYFQVHRLDFINGVWEKMVSLNKDAIFVGNTSAVFSILPDDDDPVIRSNCIYFSNDFYRKKCIYNLEDGSIQRFPKKADRAITCLASLPLWISPSSLSCMASLGHVPPPDDDEQPSFMKLVAFLALLTFIGVLGLIDLCLLHDFIN